MTQVAELYLGGTQITDAGLECLTGLGGLYRLSLTNTKVTRYGAAKLQQALPNCMIETGMLTPSGLLLAVLALAVALCLLFGVLFGVYRWVWARRKTEKGGPGNGSVERQGVGVGADVQDRPSSGERRRFMPYSGERVLVAVLRWTARAIGIAILLLLVFVNLLKYDGDLPDFLLGISPRESPILVGELIIAIGLIVAWKWEGLGGILLLGGSSFCAVVGYSPEALAYGGALGLLFLFCWWRTPKRKGGRRIIAGVVLLMLLPASAVALNALREWAIDRDCEQVIAWVRSSHPAPGSYPGLPMPAEFRWLSIHGAVDAVVLKDGRVVLLLKTLLFGHDNDSWKGIVYSSSPLKPGELYKDDRGVWILIRDTPQDNYPFGVIETKVNDRLYFVEFDSLSYAPQGAEFGGDARGKGHRRSWQIWRAIRLVLMWNTETRLHFENTSGLP